MEMAHALNKNHSRTQYNKIVDLKRHNDTLCNLFNLYAIQLTRIYYYRRKIKGIWHKITYQKADGIITDKDRQTFQLICDILKIKLELECLAGGGVL